MKVRDSRGARKDVSTCGRATSVTGPVEINEPDLTQVIRQVPDDRFADLLPEIFFSGSILGSLNDKIKSANRGSKSRSSVANLFAWYVVVEDHIQQGDFDGNAGAP